MKLNWLPLALLDMEAIRSYYAEAVSENVAAKQLAKVSRSLALLQTQPYMGHVSQNDADGDVLEWHIPSTTYTVPYMIIGEEIYILRVFDARQKRPESWH